MSAGVHGTMKTATRMKSEASTTLDVDGTHWGFGAENVVELLVGVALTSR